MKCTHIERLLPLFVSGDLTTQQADSVRAHLFACELCSESAGRYEASRSWLVKDGKPDFDDRFYDQLRSSVWRKIEAQQEPLFRFPSWMWAVSFAVALVVALGIFVVRQTRPSAHVTPELEARMHPSPGVVQLAVEKPSLDSKKAVRKRTSIESRSHSTSRRQMLPTGRPRESVSVKHLRPRIDSEPPVEVVGQPGAVMQKIELQTADPTVRIIWLIPGAKPQTQDGPLGF